MEISGICVFYRNFQFQFHHLRQRTRNEIRMCPFIHSFMKLTIELEVHIMSCSLYANFSLQKKNVLAAVKVTSCAFVSLVHLIMISMLFMYMLAIKFINSSVFGPRINLNLKLELTKFLKHPKTKNSFFHLASCWIN